jgi:hypothetical protein
MTLDQISRTEYMENSSELHHAYWSQFVTPATMHFVESRIGLAKLLKSNDEHLNDVVKWQNGGRNWLWDQSPMNTPLARELGECASASSHTCVGKAAARILLENAK